MRVAIPFGQETTALDLAPGRLIVLQPVRQSAEPVADAAAAVRFALEHPHNFPPLRRALTAEDRVTVVVDEELPDPAALLEPILEHVTSAGVSPEAVTLLCAFLGGAGLAGRVAGRVRGGSGRSASAAGSRPAVLPGRHRKGSAPVHQPRSG